MANVLTMLLAIIFAVVVYDMPVKTDSFIGAAWRALWPVPHLLNYFRSGIPLQGYCPKRAIRNH